MPQFKPFKAHRAARNYSDHFSLASIDSLSADEKIKMLNDHPHSYMTIISPTLVHSERSVEERLAEVRERFDQACIEEILNKDPESFYFYVQTKPNGDSFHGFIGLVPTSALDSGEIRKHENTLEEREKIFTHYLNDTLLQAEPVMLTFPANEQMDWLVELIKRKSHTVQFMDPRGNQHTLWKVDDRLQIQQIIKAFSSISTFYIADGHHRMGSTHRLSNILRESDTDSTGREPYNYVLSFLIPSNKLKIFDFNRLVKKLKLPKEEFLEKLRVFADVFEQDSAYYPNKKHIWGMYLGDKHYAVYLKPEITQTAGAKTSLDVELWEILVQKQILEIDDARNAPLLSFLKGSGNVQSSLDLQAKVDSGDYEVGFSFFPVAVQELMQIADDALTMPPKSTYIEPKLLTGLTIFDMKI